MISPGRREEPYRESFTRKETWKKNQVIPAKVTRKFLGFTRDVVHHLYGISSRPSKPTTNPRAAARQQSLQSPRKSSFLPLCSLHPHLPLFLFNPDKGNVSDKRALPPLERDRAPACVKRRSGSNLSSRLISHGKPILPGPSSGSPAHKGTLSPLNDKQFCDAGAGKRIRQVQGSLENRCVRGAAIWGRVNSWGEQTRNCQQ